MWAVSRPNHRQIVGETIRTYRKQVSLSQASVAENANSTAKYLGEVEHGYVNISVDALVRIARALHIQVHDLTRGFWELITDF